MQKAQKLKKRKKMENTNDLNKLMEVIGIVISSHGGVIYPKAKLVKLLYLIDIEFAKNYRNRITKATYKSYFFGPCSDDIDRAIDQLKKLELIDIDKNFSLCPEEKYFKIKLKSIPNFGTINEKEKTFVKNIALQYRNKSLDSILGKVYNTDEFSKTNFGEEIIL